MRKKLKIFHKVIDRLSTEMDYTVRDYFVYQYRPQEDFTVFNIIQNEKILYNNYNY